MAMMMQRVEIFDTGEDGALALDLGDLLKLVEEYRDLHWYLLELEATGILRGHETIVQLERRIALSPHGLKMDWSELTTLAEQVTQTINATLAGCRPDVALPVLPLKPQQGLEIVIEAIDSTLWAVSTNYSKLVQLLKTGFKSTKLVTWTG